MLTTEEQAALQSLLGHAVNPAETMSLTQLEGYLFGLSITPDVIQPIEWFLDIFGEAFASFADTEQADLRIGALLDVYDRLGVLHQGGLLGFPLELQASDASALERLQAWVGGLDRALALRSYLWLPEDVLDQPQMAEEDEKILTCLMVVMGVAQPSRIPEIFDGLGNAGKDEQEIWLHLVAQLPQAVTALIDFSRTLRQRRPESLPEKN